MTGMNERGLIAAIAMLAAALLPAVAGAEIKLATADALQIEHRYGLSSKPLEAWDVLVHPERYWPSDHTWSGDAKNLRLTADAGGCFCERWTEASAEHGRVVMAVPGRVLRIRGALGPFQEMAVTGVLTVKLTPQGDGTEAVVTYRLSGDAAHKLADAAAAVDQVVGLQFGNFAKLASPASPQERPGG
jgi:uncharacterized protein YndB with AHSA1/START domain